MAPLIILLVSFAILFLFNKLALKSKLTLSFVGRAALATMLIFTGIAHFTRTEAMVLMLPDFIIFRKEIVYATGILEILASIGLLIQKLSKLTSVLLIAFFFAVLPANIVGSIKQVNLGLMNKGADYLFFRVPLQILFIFWAYYFGVKKG